MPAEWMAREEEDFVDSLFSLQGEIQALANRGRAVNVRLNVRELVAPLSFGGVSEVSVRALSTMMREVAAIRAHLSQLAEKLSLLAGEIFAEGGVA